MERVTGIGGVFLRAKDPDALQGWYEQNLGLQPDEDGCVVFRWTERETNANAGTVWAPFKEDTDYFGSRDQQSMVNYRVKDLDAMLAQLRVAGATVDDKIEDSKYGKFGWATDPEGNRMELWQPPANEA
tara:strand:+ start:162 stop:548 length:387 start_codon:yes stop_codon:yes gene_type:complete